MPSSATISPPPPRVRLTMASEGAIAQRLAGQLGQVLRLRHTHAQIADGQVGYRRSGMAGNQDVAARRGVDPVKGDAVDPAQRALLRALLLGAVGPVVDVDEDGVMPLVPTAVGDPDIVEPDVFIDAAMNHEHRDAIARIGNRDVGKQAVAHSRCRTGTEFDRAVIGRDPAVDHLQPLDHPLAHLGHDPVIADRDQAVGNPHIVRIDHLQSVGVGAVGWCSQRHTVDDDIVAVHHAHQEHRGITNRNVAHFHIGAALYDQAEADPVAIFLAPIIRT